MFRRFIKTPLVPEPATVALSLRADACNPRVLPWGGLTLARIPLLRAGRENRRSPGDELQHDQRRERVRVRISTVSGGERMQVGRFGRIVRHGG
jgi:hypothetical protein